MNKKNIMRKILRIIGIIAILVLLTCVAQASDWPMFHHDARHTGYTTENVPDELELLWSYETGSDVSSSPAVADGKVFVGSSDKKIYCLNEDTGSLIWSYTTGAEVYSSPAVAGGKVFVGSLDKKIYCIDADDGSLIWSYETGDFVCSSPAVANSKVYVGSYDHKIYCIDADDGSLIWSYETGECVDSSPAVANSKVYVGSHDGKIYCLDADDGSLIWSYKTGDLVFSPAVANSKVYVGSYDHKIYCLDADDGSLIWSYKTGKCVLSSPAVANSKVYVGSYSDHKIYCLDADDGSLIWSYETGGFVSSSPAVANSKVYVGSYDHKIYCFCAKTTTPTPPPNSPPNTPGRPSGSSSVFPGTYTYSTSATDPDGDRVQYRFDWDDGTVSSWGSFVSSGSSAYESHSWSSAGTYYVRAQARDTQGATSSWSSAKTVSISTPAPTVTPTTAIPQIVSTQTPWPTATPATPRPTPAPTAKSKSTPIIKPTPTPTPSASISPSAYIRLIKFVVAIIVIFLIVGRLRKGKKSKSEKTAEDWFDLGYNAHDAKKKVEYYTKCLELNPKDTAAWNNMGNALRNLERHEEAIKCYDKALEINPRFDYAWNNKGLTLDDLGRHKEAVRYIDKALEINPKYANAWNNKGLALGNLGRYEEALRCYDRALEINPNFEEAKTNKRIAEEKIKEVSAKVKEHRLAIERAIYDPCKRDFIERRLPRMKEWINRYDPGAYWFAVSIQNNTDKAIEEWGIELETSSALKIKEAKIEGIEIEIPHESHLSSFKISVPKEYGIVIPKGGAQRVYFKLRADKPKTTYEIGGVFKSGIGEVPIRAKEFKYLCDAGVPPEAVKAELKKAFSEKDAARLALSFKTVQELDRMCDREAKTDEYLAKLSGLRNYTEGFSDEFTRQVDDFLRFMEQEQLEYLDDAYKGKVRSFCTNLVDVWISEFLR